MTLMVIMRSFVMPVMVTRRTGRTRMSIWIGALAVHILAPRLLLFRTPSYEENHYHGGNS
jgi:hypothetical protein